MLEIKTISLYKSKTFSSYHVIRIKKRISYKILTDKPLNSPNPKSNVCHKVRRIQVPACQERQAVFLS